MLAVTEFQPYTLSPHKTFIMKFLEQIPKKSLILVVGCGDGKINFDISQEGFKVIGLDNDRVKIETARHTLIDLEFVVGSALSVKYEADAFQGVWLTGFFAKLSEEDQVKALENIKRILGKNGTLYLSFPAAQKEAITRLLDGFDVQHQDVGLEIKLICKRHG